MLIQAYKTLFIRLWRDAMPEKPQQLKLNKPIKKAFESPPEGFTIDIINRGHTLIGGQTGSGKSNILKHLIKAILYSDSDLILIDPKFIDLRPYKENALYYADDLKSTITALDIAVELIEKRKIKTINNPGFICGDKKVFVIVDELADLLLNHKKDVLPKLVKIANLGRALNIFLICATQSPNKATIPANLILNFPNCIALHCFSGIESKQIIGVKGAENLPKFGKAIIKSDDLKIIDIPLYSD